MTPSLYWKPLGDGIHLDVGGAPSGFIHNMDKVFGAQPWTLSIADLSKLEVLANLFEGQARDNPYQTIIEAIDENGPVQVWPVY